MRFPKIMGSEAGYALPMALVLLLLGGFLVIPSLNLISTSLNAHRMVDENTLELYAADAGIEKALWHIRYDTGFTMPANGAEQSLPQFTMNSKTVNVKINKESGQPHKITSTATGDDGHSTTIECYGYYQPDFSWLFDNAITSADSVTLRSGVTVTGGIRSPITPSGSGSYDSWTPGSVELPTAEELSDFYLLQVQGAATIPDGYTIDISTYTQANPRSIWNGGALYAQGDLEIKGNGWARLDGTVYIKGNLTVMPDTSIDLNGQTIYAEGSITFQPGSTVYGSGCIIAEGNIDFQPNIGSDPSDFLFIMSIEGQVKIQPNGSLYGAVVGDTDVTLQPGCTLTLTALPEEGLNFPGGSGNNLKIVTYTIK